MSLFKLRWVVWIGLSHLLLVTVSANQNIRPVGEVSLAEALNLFQNDFATLAWLGSEIGDMNLRDFVDHLLDDSEPLQSYIEEDGEGPYVPCTPDSFDADGCEAAVNPPQ